MDLGIIITGLHRSGTSILRRTVTTHPQIRITGEFGCYLYPEMSNKDHNQYIFRRWMARKNNPFAKKKTAEVGKGRGFHVGKNLLFVMRYLTALRRQKTDLITSSSVNLALRNALPASQYVGDKYPDYWFQMDRFAADPHIRCVVIVRDVRDVVSSSLVKARGAWSSSWPAEMRDAAAVARRWVKMADLVERNRDQIHVVYYEQFVTAPQISLAQLAAFLEIDGEGFDYSRVSNQSIGKYKQGLSPEELSRVVVTAGDAMQAFGYDLQHPGLKDAAS